MNDNTLAKLSWPSLCGGIIMQLFFCSFLYIHCCIMLYTPYRKKCFNVKFYLNFLQWFWFYKCILNESDPLRIIIWATNDALLLNGKNKKRFASDLYLFAQELSQGRMEIFNCRRIEQNGRMYRPFWYISTCILYSRQLGHFICFLFHLIKFSIK